MKIYTHLDKALMDACAGGTSIAVGMFDGVHLGHRALIQKAVDEARRQALRSLAFTFARHPLQLLAPPYAPELLTLPGEKAELIAGLGIDLLLMLDFTEEFAATEAREFVDRILVGMLKARVLSCGEDFRFGRKGAGDVELLRSRALVEDFAVVVSETVQALDGPVRSTRIRAALLEGNLREANTLLARPYCLSGRVVEGDRRGRTIGYPTANLELDPQRLAPHDGVYAVRARLGAREPAERQFEGMMNIGKRPTFGVPTRGFEVHLFDFDEEIYGQQLEVAMVSRLRDTLKFDGIQALTTQLALDERAARQALAG